VVDLSACYEQLPRIHFELMEASAWVSYRPEG